MKKNKGNENNNEHASGLRVPSLWKKIQTTPWVALELADFGTPKAALGDLLVLGDALYKQRILGGTVASEGASDRMKDACGLGGKILAHNTRWAATRPTDMAGRRKRLVHAATGVVDIFDVHVRTGSTTAATLKERTFGVDFVPGQLSTRTLYLRLGEVEAMARDDAAFREELEGHVPKTLLAELFAARRAVGERWEVKPGEPVIDLRPVTEYVRQRMTEYVVSVLGTVNGHDPETVGRAKLALLPLTEFRAEQSAKRGRRADKVEDEAEVDDTEAPDLDDADEPPETPATAPAVTTPQ